MVTRRIRVRVKDRWYTVEVSESGGYPVKVVVDGEAMEVEVDTSAPTSQSPKPSIPPKPQGGPIGLQGIIESGSKIVRSPMPGRIVAVSLQVWDRISPGAEVCIIETMKMEQSIQISVDGAVRAVFIEPGAHVNAGEPLIQLE